MKTSTYENDYYFGCAHRRRSKRRWEIRFRVWCLEMDMRPISNEFYEAYEWAY